MMKRVLSGFCNVTVRMRLLCEIEQCQRKRSTSLCEADIARELEPPSSVTLGGNFDALQQYDPAFASLPSYHVLNEVVLDRGPSPFISNLQIFCDDVLVTVVQGDGLIIATPTGSTAYSV